MAAIWDISLSPEVPTFTWTDANTSKSASDYNEYIKVITCNLRNKKTRLADVDWLTVGFRFATLMELKYSREDMAEGHSEAESLKDYWQAMRQEYFRLPTEHMPKLVREVLKTMTKDKKTKGMVNPLAKKASAVYKMMHVGHVEDDDEEEEPSFFAEEGMSEELVQAHVKHLNKLEEQEGFLRIVDGVIQVSSCVEEAKKLKLSWQTSLNADAQLRMIYLSKIQDFNEIGLAASTLKKDIARLPTQGFNTHQESRAEVYAAKYEECTEELVRCVDICMCNKLPWPGSPMWRTSLTAHRMKLEPNMNPEFAARADFGDFKQHAEILDNAPDIECYISAVSGSIKYPKSRRPDNNCLACATWLRSRLRWTSMVFTLPPAHGLPPAS